MKDTWKSKEEDFGASSMNKEDVEKYKKEVEDLKKEVEELKGDKEEKKAKK